MRIKLDRTLCAGFMRCADHAPESFSLDDWGYASLASGGSIQTVGSIAPEDEAGVRRALLDCPVHAIIELPDPAVAAVPGIEGIASAAVAPSVAGIAAVPSVAGIPAVAERMRPGPEHRSQSARSD